MHVCAHVHVHEYAYTCKSTGVKVRGLCSGVLYLLPLWVLSTELKLLGLCAKRLVFKFKRKPVSLSILFFTTTFQFFQFFPPHTATGVMCEHFSCNGLKTGCHHLHLKRSLQEFRLSPRETRAGEQQQSPM